MSNMGRKMLRAMKPTSRPRAMRMIGSMVEVRDLTATSFVWFSSQASAGFGGQFVMQIPFSLNSSDGSTNLLTALDSVTVSMANDRGQSNQLTVRF